MKKNLSPVVTLRKSVIGVALGIAVLIMCLVTYNVYQGAARPAGAEANNHDLTHRESSADATWYAHQVVQKAHARPSVSGVHTVETAVGTSLDAPEQDTLDAQAMAAVITSNQLLAEGESKVQEPSSDNNVSPTLNADSNTLVQNPSSPYTVEAGTLIPGILLTGISSDLPKDVLGQVRRPVYDSLSGCHVLIPAGAKLIGSYDAHVAYGQERLAVSWQRLILPNGQSFALHGMPGMDASGAVGFADQVDHHTGSVLKGALLGGILSMGSLLSPTKTLTDQAISTASAGELYAQNLAGSVQGVASPLAEKQMNVQPTLHIRPGYSFTVLVTRDMVFPGPYPE